MSPEEYTNQCKSQPVPSPDKDRGFGDRKSIRLVKHPAPNNMLDNQQIPDHDRASPC